MLFLNDDELQKRMDPESKHNDNDGPIEPLEDGKFVVNTDGKCIYWAVGQLSSSEPTDSPIKLLYFYTSEYPRITCWTFLQSLITENNDDFCKQCFNMNSEFTKFELQQNESQSITQTPSEFTRIGLQQ